MRGKAEPKTDWGSFAAFAVFLIFAMAMQIGISTKNGALPVGVETAVRVAPFATTLLALIILSSATLMRSSVMRALGGLSAMLSLSWLLAMSVGGLMQRPTLPPGLRWDSPVLADRVAYLVQAILFWPGAYILLAVVSLALIARLVYRDTFGRRQSSPARTTKE